MKLDVEMLRYLGADEFRMLHAVEVGMRNHEYVPTRMLGTSELSTDPAAAPLLQTSFRVCRIGLRRRVGGLYVRKAWALSQRECWSLMRFFLMCRELECLCVDP